MRWWACVPEFLGRGDSPQDFGLGVSEKQEVSSHGALWLGKPFINTTWSSLTRTMSLSPLPSEYRHISINTVYGLVSWPDVKFFFHSFTSDCISFASFLCKWVLSWLLSQVNQSVNQHVDLNSLVISPGTLPWSAAPGKTGTILGQFTLPVWTQGPCMLWTITPQPHPKREVPWEDNRMQFILRRSAQVDSSETAGDTRVRPHTCSLPAPAHPGPRTRLTPKFPGANREMPLRISVGSDSNAAWFPYWYFLHPHFSNVCVRMVCMHAC